MNLSPRDLLHLRGALTSKIADLDQERDREVIRELKDRINDEIDRTFWRSDGLYAKRGTIEMFGPFVNGQAASEYALRRNRLAV